MGAEGLVEEVTSRAIEKAGDLLKDTIEGVGVLLKELLGND